MLKENIKNWVLKMDNQYNLGLCHSMGIHAEYGIDASAPKKPRQLHDPFRLPITYLPPEEIRPLSETVSADLELTPVSTYSTNTHDYKSIYEYLLKPKHTFARNLIPDWNRYFTTHQPFLEDSQGMIFNMAHYLERMKCPFYPSDGDPPNCPPIKDKESVYEFTQQRCAKIQEIWSDIKEDSEFLEKYGYIEWGLFKHLNRSPAFLQSLSLINMSSPIMSFIVPIVFLVFPFIILKIQGIPITFSMYIKVLKDIARHHFIGKTLSSIQKLSWDKLIYLIITVGLYGLQIYQNITTCYRFYRNIAMINGHLADLRDFLEYSMRSMDIYLDLNRPFITYSAFNETTMQNRETIGKIYEVLKKIQPFQPGFSKIAEIGYLLRCFYEVYENEAFSEGIRYAIGFEGYINNLTGIHENFISQKIVMAKFSTEATQMKQLYYPPYLENPEHIKNTCDLSSNIIITGPNASGKTTLLKAATINIIFTQQFGCGFYGDCTLTPYTHIHSYLNIPDTSGRDSLFQAESRRCKEIINIIHAPLENQPNTASKQAKHFCIFDELYSGTNPKEASKSAYAFLLYLSKYKNVDFILTTHYVKICKRLEKKLRKYDSSKYRKIGNYKMVVSENPTTKRIEYTYKMKKGISKIQGAVLVLEDMCYPQEIIDEVKRG